VFVLCSLQTLILRTNFIERIENLDHLTNLTYLDLYENRIEVIQNLQHLSQLTYLDLSFNGIRVVEVSLAVCYVDQVLLDGCFKCNACLQNLKGLAKLRDLFLVQNKISEIPPDAFVGLPSLTQLELGSNRLRVSSMYLSKQRESSV